MAVMSDQVHEFDKPLAVEPLGFRATVAEIIIGIAITVGLALLWALESVRNTFFRLLDRFGVKGRPHRANAFPPGRPRKLKR
jgi:hypothetical protein